MIRNTLLLVRIVVILLVSGVFFCKKGRELRIKNALIKLGPSFVKLGQTLSVRPDVVGDKLADTLAHLQDRIAPFSTKTAKKIVERELGMSVSDIFSEFSEDAVAAASIAQVHKAVTKEGHKVAVKILRPRVERRFANDISLFYAVADFLKRFKKCKRLKPVEVVDVLADSVKKELDLRLEAASASELAENCKNDEEIYIPKVYWQYTSQRVLVIEWIDGIQINDKKALLAAGHDLEKITENLSKAFLNQSYRDGFFHADIHPGNLFVDAQGRIAPVDFGIMGRLDRQTRIFVAEILRGFLTGDYMHVAQVHFDAGYVPKHKSIYDFQLACRAIGEPIMGLPANQVSIARLLALLFKITEDFDMETQPQLLLLQKTMVLVEGVGQKLYPQVNMWEQAEGWIKIWAKENLGVEARLKRHIKEMAEILVDMPETLKKLDAVLDKMARGS